MLPAEGAPFSPSEGERERYADTAAQTQEARLTPFPGTGEFRPRRAGIAAARRQGAKGDRTPRFPVPSCDSPTFL